ncbi:amidase domain-containing protein [Plantactinospora sonchi]|uniref:Amidase domain-containing protein n=1 Tax=Plantactinospora sonchi TaxID=1544735 RepID=A0ABU7RLX9_9ACTN
MRTPARILAAGATLAFAVLLTPTSALAAVPSTAELAGIAEGVLVTENAALLSGAAQSRALAGARPAVAPSAAGTLAARQAVQADRDYARRLAGAEFTSVDTSVTVVSSAGSGTRRSAEVVEETTYRYAGSAQEYQYTARHQVRYLLVDQSWRLADITALNPASEFSAAQLTRVTRIPEAVRRAEIAERITTMRASLAANRTALAAGDATKLANRRVPAADAERATPDKTERVGATSAIGRPADRPLPAPDRVAQPMGGEGPPYNYQAMVDFALFYARDNPVTYTRDTNDCTTFISWALWTGRYAEAGSEDYPAVLWNHDDYDVWYWRCNDCTPIHSYTWGGATNWNIYENNYGGRVTFMPYLDDLLISDVMQLEIDGYGETDSPDHTMMVTGRGTDGWPLLSYHSDDTEDKPFWDIISQHDGPYWAART